MSTAQPPMPQRRIASILWFPIFFAIALPVTFEVAYHQPQPHNVPIAVVGQASQVRLVTDELRGIDAGGFAVGSGPQQRPPSPRYATGRSPPPTSAMAPPPWPAASLLPSSTWFPWQPVTAARGYSSSSSR